MSKKIIIIQPEVPSYRVPLFERLYESYGDRFRVYASKGALGILTEREFACDWERLLGPMKTFFSVVEWQCGALAIPMSRGDIVCMSGSPRTLTNLLLFIKAKLLGCKTIIWGHYWSATSKSWRVALRMKLICRSDLALFYADREIAEFERIVKCRSAPMLMALNNGLDTKEIDRLRKHYRAKARGKRILFIGRLTAKSELIVLLKAMSKPSLHDVCLDVIGDGASADELKCYADRFGIGDRVLWLGGIVGEEKIASIANRCRLFVYPGSVGLSLIHAMAYGLPAVLHGDRWSHMPEITAFERGRTGEVFKRGDASSLADVISELINAPELLDVMSANAVGIISKSFNVEDMTARFCAAISALETQQ